MRQSEERYISLLNKGKQMVKDEDSKKAFRDIKNSIDTAKREGIKEGIEKG